jgi:hypothetical protein
VTRPRPEMTARLSRDSFPRCFWFRVRMSRSDRRAMATLPLARDGAARGSHRARPAAGPRLIRRPRASVTDTPSRRGRLRAALMRRSSICRTSRTP